MVARVLIVSFIIFPTTKNITHRKIAPNIIVVIRDKYRNRRSLSAKIESIAKYNGCRLAYLYSPSNMIFGSFDRPPCSSINSASERYPLASLGVKMLGKV
jgi:hypothetical protein